MTHQDIAHDFMQKVVAGHIRQAFKDYVAPDFHHHNPNFTEERNSLQQAMEENHIRFPNKTFTIHHTLANNDLVAIHSTITLSPTGPHLAAVHIFRFANNKIAELWDISQLIQSAK